MVQLDMDMPQECARCRLQCMIRCMGTEDHRSVYTPMMAGTKPKWCPLFPGPEVIEADTAAFINALIESYEKDKEKGCVK